MNSNRDDYISTEEDALYVKDIAPIIHLRYDARRCYGYDRIIFSCLCTVFIFFIFIISHDNINLFWTETDLSYKDRVFYFKVINTNYFIPYNIKENHIKQMYWDCDDWSKQNKNCEWVVSQEIPINKDFIYPGSKIDIIISMNETNPYLLDMEETCRYGVLTIYYILDSFKSPAYVLCNF